MKEKENIHFFEEVLSERQQAKVYSICKNLYSMCKDLFEKEDMHYFEAGLFINNLCIVSYGGDWHEPHTILIDDKGDLVDVDLDKSLKMSKGKIVTLTSEDNVGYFYDIYRIPQKTHYLWGWGSEVNGNTETSYIAIKITHYTKGDYSGSTFIIDSKKHVVANFLNLDTYKDIEGYGICHVYMEREFFFLTDERYFFVFSQRLMVEKDNNPIYGWDMIDDMKGEYFKESPKCEWKMDEDEWIETLQQDFFETFYGIVDCSNFASGQLLPITNELSTVEEIIHDRCNKINPCEELPIYNQGWSDDDMDFKGEIIDNGLLYDNVTRLKGLSIRYAFKYYPELVLKSVQEEMILIPNDVLDTLDNNEYLRNIHILQEQHLQYNCISSIHDSLRSSDAFGITSMYNGMTLDEIVHHKGGTKYLVNMIEKTNLEIDTNVLYELKQRASDCIEMKCYDILVTHILYKKERKEWFEELLDEERIRNESRQEQEDIERDMYYALGGYDYDSWKQAGGDIDTTIEQMGLS